MFITAEGETAPLTSDGDDWYLKVLIKCPPIWVRSLSPEMKQREQYVAPRNTQMLEDAEESMPAERYQTNGELAISPLDETENFSLMLSRLRSLSILNPEETDDAELLKDLRGLGKPPVFDGNDTCDPFASHR